MKSNLAIIQSQINQLACRQLAFIILPFDFVPVELAKKCTILQSLAKKITLLINELTSVYIREARIWGDLKSVALEQLIELARECSTLQSLVTLQVYELMCVYVRVASCWNRVKLMKQLLELARECATLQSSVTLLVREVMHVYVQEAQYLGYLKRIKLMEELFELARECTTLQSLLVNELRSMYVQEVRFLGYSKHVKLLEQLIELARECTTLQSSVTLLVCELMSVHVQEKRLVDDLKSVELMEQLLVLVKESTILQSSVILLVNKLRSSYVQKTLFWGCAQEKLLAKVCTTLQSWIKSVTLLLNELRFMYVQEARCLGYSKHMKLMEQLIELARECATLQSSVTVLVRELMHDFYVQVRQLLKLVRECTTLLSSVTLLVREVRSVHVEEERLVGDPKNVKLMEQLLELARKCTTLQSSVTMLVCELMHEYAQHARCFCCLNLEELIELLLELVREYTNLQSSVSLLVRDLRSVHAEKERLVSDLKSVKLIEQLLFMITKICTTLKSSVTLLINELRSLYVRKTPFWCYPTQTELLAKEYTTLQLQSLIKSVTLLVDELRSMYVQEAQFLGYLKHVKLMKLLVELARECTTLQLPVTMLVHEHIHVQEARYLSRFDLIGYKIFASNHKLMEQLLELVREYATLQSSVSTLVCELRSVYFREARFWRDLKSVKLMERLLVLVKESTNLQSSVTLLVKELMYVQAARIWGYPTQTEQLAEVCTTLHSLFKSVTLLVNELRSMYVSMQEARCLGYLKHVKLMEQLLMLSRECTTLQSPVTLLVCELMSVYVGEERLVGDQRSVEQKMEQQLLVLVKECSTLHASVTLLVNELRSMHVQEAQFLGYSRQTELSTKEYTAMRSLINSVTLQVKELMIREPQSWLVNCMEQLLEQVKECITLLYSNFQSELIIENFLEKAHFRIDLTLVDQTMNYTALQPLNVQLLFSTGALLFFLSINNYSICIGPQPVVLNNRKPDTHCTCHSTTLLSSNFQSELVLENILDETHLHQDLTPVEQTMNYVYTAFKPLNEQPLFLTGALLFPLSNNNYLAYTGPQPVILNNRKPDTLNSWPFHFGVTTFDLFVKHWLDVEGVLNKLVNLYATYNILLIQ